MPLICDWRRDQNYTADAHCDGSGQYYVKTIGIRNKRLPLKSVYDVKKIINFIYYTP